MNATQHSPQEVRCDPDFDRLKRHVIETTGLAYYCDKDHELAARIASRLAASNSRGCGAYLARLGDGVAGQAELDALTASLTIGETFFFRHRELFDALRERVIPDLIERNREHQRLRIWSAGCATGAEPYSLAILLGHDFAPALAGWDVSIIGTDINRDFLAEAQRGAYGEWAFRAAPEELKATCFDRSGQSWVLRDAYRRCVSFQYHNLVQHPFPSLVNNLASLDLILCRNVMIYFNATICARLIGQFYEALAEGGWLAVGHAEPNVDLFRAFHAVNCPGAVLYQKCGMPAPSLICVEPGSTWMFDLPVPQVAPPAPASVPQRERPSPPRHRPLRSEGPNAVTLADVRSRLNRGQWEAAAEGCRRLATVERLNPLLHFYHALVAEQTGKHGEAEQALRRAMYLDRNFVLAHYYLGLVLMRNHNSLAAERSFRNVLSLLSQRDAAETFPDADGLTVAALAQLSQMHLDMLQHP